MQRQPTGLCQCGCGQPTPIARSSRKGLKRGEPTRFIRGHHTRRDLLERFWEKVDKGDPDECWEWTASRSADGYGRIYVDPRLRVASHVALELAGGGPLPAGACVLHSCDNPPCVNPAHLFVGTQVTNMADMVSKGRSSRRRGSLAPRAKLTEEIVREIRSGAHSSTDAEMARRFGVSETAVRFARIGRNWGHIA